MCCDLLRIYYFCTINHSISRIARRSRKVVICFEFIIFALSITAAREQEELACELWFASNLLFLHYQSQLIKKARSLLSCCDLLRIYYFCTINHSYHNKLFNLGFVVICFEFIIFALSITALSESSKGLYMLWFASNLLFLHYQSQPFPKVGKERGGCDLLRIYYFCTINHSTIINYSTWDVLWFASNLLFLHYQSQHHNKLFNLGCVVICFEFIIFALSITAP